MNHCRKPYLAMIAILCLSLFACGGTDAPAQEEVRDTGQEQAVATEPVVEAAQPEEEGEQFDGELSLYESSNGVFLMRYPSDWVINEVPQENGLAFGITARRELFESRPDFSEPIVFSFGSTGQIEPALATLDNLANLHAQAYANHPLFTFVPQGEPTVTQPSPFIAYYVMQANSTEPDGAVVRWMLATALADLTVVHFGVGVSEAGFERYGQLALDMFNSVEVDTLVTAELAGGP